MTMGMGRFRMGMGEFSKKSMGMGKLIQTIRVRAESYEYPSISVKTHRFHRYPSITHQYPSIAHRYPLISIDTH